MIDYDNKSLSQVNSNALVRVGNSIIITKKLLAEFNQKKAISSTQQNKSSIEALFHNHLPIKKVLGYYELLL